VIVRTSIKEYFIYMQTARNLVLYQHFTFLSHLFHLSTKGGIFPIFPLLD
jgi:hypothetical protein